MAEANLNEKSQFTDYSTDTVRAYLQEIGKIPLLTQEQECILGKQVRAMMTLVEKKEEKEAITQRQLNFSEWADLVRVSEKELQSYQNLLRIRRVFHPKIMVNNPSLRQAQGGALEISLKLSIY